MREYDPLARLKRYGCLTGRCTAVRTTRDGDAHYSTTVKRARAGEARERQVGRGAYVV